MTDLLTKMNPWQAVEYTCYSLSIVICISTEIAIFLDKRRQYKNQRIENLKTKIRLQRWKLL